MNNQRRIKFCSKNLINRSLPVIAVSAILVLLLVDANVYSFPPAFAVDSILRSSEQVYLPGDPLVLYGKSEPNDLLVVRIFDPAGRAIRIDNIPTDKDGFFRETIFHWPQPTKNLPFGVYSIQITSSKGETLQTEITFAAAIEGDGITPRIPKTHILGVKMDAPAQVSVNTKFRIFVQVTFDGALVDSDDVSLLGSSHIHSGKENSTINIPSFTKLHEGLYYADMALATEGSFVIHAAAFYRGYLSHDSRVVTASGATINTVQDAVDRLDARLNSTNKDLNSLETTLEETRLTLSDTKSSITDSLEEARSSIKNDIVSLEDASGQVNSIILPILALISVIIALQISLFARIRASYR